MSDRSRIVEHERVADRERTGRVEPYPSPAVVAAVLRNHAVGDREGSAGDEVTAAPTGVGEIAGDGAVRDPRRPAGNAASERYGADVAIARIEPIVRNDAVTNRHRPECQN